MEATSSKDAIRQWVRKDITDSEYNSGYYPSSCLLFTPLVLRREVNVLWMVK
jgi:hypothetical protein